MALGDDECEFDHSQNDDLRMCGMTGDDEDDNVQDDVVAAFGRSAADPHPRDDDGIPVDVVVADPEGDGGNSEVAGSNQPSTSDVWEDFDKLCKKVPGKKNPVRYGAVCKHCKKKYSAYFANGTGHLTRHLKVVFSVVRNVACLKLILVLTLMVLLEVGHTMLILLVLNLFVCLLG